MFLVLIRSCGTGMVGVWYNKDVNVLLDYEAAEEKNSLPTPIPQPGNVQNHRLLDPKGLVSFPGSGVYEIEVKGGKLVWEAVLSSVKLCDPQPSHS